MNRGPDGRRLTPEHMEEIAVTRMGKDPAELKALKGEKQKAWPSYISDLTRATRYNMPELILDTGDDEVSRFAAQREARAARTAKAAKLHPGFG